MLGNKIAATLDQKRFYRTNADWLRSIACRLKSRYGTKGRAGRQDYVRVRLKSMDHPLYIRTGTTDYRVLKQIYFQAEYDFLLDRNPASVRSVLDLGANVGFFARFVGQAWPEARIVCVEPDGGNAEALRKNIEAGAMRDSVRIYETCVAATSRAVALDRSAGQWAYAMKEPAAGEEIMEAVTLPRLLEALPGGEVDLLKCDVEGAEKELFADCRDWIGRVHTLVVETHAGYTPGDLLNALSANGSPLREVETMDKGHGQYVVHLERAA